MEFVPPFWHIMLEQLFDVHSARLRTELWRHYPASMSLRWQLGLCSEPAASPAMAMERVRRLSQLLEPALLLRAAERIAHPGHPRPRELRDFENRVLRLVNAEGKWIWIKEKNADGPGSMSAAHGGTRGAS
jgi:hypothetical protein